MTKDFNSICLDGEWLDGFQVIDTNWDKEGICKRCGREFIKKYPEQIFCSRKCVSAYRQKMNEKIAEYGRDFTKWLNDKRDTSYAPERF